MMKNRVCHLWFGLMAWMLIIDFGMAVAQTVNPVRTMSTVAPAGTDFNKHVRPILATHCFPCHGPDEASRAADLRLDSFAGATADLGGYHAISPGAVEESELWKRIHSSDPDYRMPPPEFNKPLDDQQAEVLKSWIASGANYEAHWAFTAPVQAALPEIDGQKFPAWTENPIDRFVLTSMLEEGLSPSPTAPTNVLIRRLFLDLIGLPPTIEESGRWQKQLDSLPLGPGGFNPSAYERLVDELLASPHYGERWARRWLDLARYADTNGYEKDRPRTIWPYRDWVISAFNRDLPFDQFTIRQLAGDLLEKADRDALIATGFHRNTMLNEEGGIDPLEYRFYAMTDRVATTGTTWLGLTLGCAQCHTHKYDPVTHREYYQLMALMNNTEEPDLELLSPEQQQDYERRLAEAEDLLAKLPLQWPMEDTNGGERELERETVIQNSFDSWLERERQFTPRWKFARPTSATSPTMKLYVESDDSIFASGDITKDDFYSLTFSDIEAGTTAIRLEVLPDDRLPGRGPGLAYVEGPKGDFFLGEFGATIKTASGTKELAFGKISETHAENNYGGDRVAADLTIDGDPQTGWTCAGQFGERNVAVFNLSEPLPENETLTITLRFGRHYPCSLGRFRLSTATHDKEVIATLTPTGIEQLLHRTADSLSSSEASRLREHFLMTAPELSEPSARIRELRKRPVAQSTLVFRERPADNPRPTHIHHRGEFLQPTELVQPDVPEFLPPMERDSNPRLAFAKWLVAPENPLTPRVQVNRAWSALFGQGLVTTEGDFGLQGNPPSHPELLDWLAVDFVNKGQSMKKLHRQLVMSATYQQSSLATEKQLRIDPQNRWLSRANRIRLEAEQIRDLVLTAAGLLNRQLYGPPVFPPQPEGAGETAYGGNRWATSKGSDRFRRGIYTFIKRTTPYAMFSTFDAPSGEFCLAQRESSNTPLQALSLMNDQVIIEAAAAMGKLISQTNSTDSERIDMLFRRCLNRDAHEQEKIPIIQFIQRQRKRILDGELEASDIAAGANVETREEGNKPSDSRLNEIAVWSLTARIVLNLDETITRN